MRRVKHTIFRFKRWSEALGIEGRPWGIFPSTRGEVCSKTWMGAWCLMEHHLRGITRWAG